jgi:imidazole glycerol-phosphate synthase subunit HisH
MPQTLVIDLGLGNSAAVENMCLRLGAKAFRSRSPQQLQDFEKIILPGVGSFDAGVKALDSSGFGEFIRLQAQCNTPILGICLGMQLLFEGSEEGQLPGLGLIPGFVKKFSDKFVKVPHMGWNTVHFRPNPLPEIHSPRFYFVHSFHCVCAEEHAWGTTRYGDDFVSAVHHKNLWGTQFHPEKSHKFGMSLLKS